MMKIVCFRKQRTGVFRNVLKLDFFVFGNGLAFCFELIEVVKRFLCILEDNFGLVLDLLLSPSNDANTC